MNLKLVGILGGMGPAATILLQKKLLNANPKAVDDIDHIPLLVDMNTQVPSRIAHLIEGTGEDPTSILVKMAKRLEESGALALAMPCNTAHHYATAIKNSVSIPFLDMVSLTVEKIAEVTKNNQAVGILGSPAVRKIGLFDDALRRLNRRAVWPADTNALLTAIELIKRQGFNIQSHSLLKNASLDLLKQNAATQIIACSEFSLMTEKLSNSSVCLIDSLDILTSAIDGFSRTKLA